MAGERSNADDPSFSDDDDEGAGESTVSMNSPHADPAVPSPISIPPTPMGGSGGTPNVSMPTAPTPFSPGSPASFPTQGRPPPASGPSVPTPFGGLTPGAPAGPVPYPPKPLPAAGAAPPQREQVTSAMGAGASGAIGLKGIKRPQTVIGLAPPPVGAPRPGQAGVRGVPLPSGKPRPAAGAPAVPTPPASEKNPPSSSRGVRPPALPNTPPVLTVNNDADATDEQLATTGEGTPDSQKPDMATMAKSAEESLALFALGSGLTDAARAAVLTKPSPAAGRSPLSTTSLAQNNRPLTPGPQPVVAGAALPPIGGQILVPPSPMIGNSSDTPLPVLHDRSEEDESTRAVSREEMLRGHDAVIIGDDGESVQGEDATLAVAPGYNEANSQNLATLDRPVGPPSQPGFPAPPHLQQPQQQGWQDPNAQPQQGWPQQPQDPNAYAQSQVPQQPWGQDPNAYAQSQVPQPQNWQQQGGYPMSVGPVSGPHLPAANSHFPGGSSHVPQSNPHLQVPQSGHMMTPQQVQQGGGPIPYPGQPTLHQAPANPFGDWNANSPQQPNKQFKVSGQILLLAIVGVVCLAIFITGIVLFATTKF